MKCVLCNRPMLAAAVSIPTRGGPINYGPVCARKAGLVQKVGPRITHHKKSAPRAGKAPSRAVVVREEQTQDLFQEEMTC